MNIKICKHCGWAYPITQEGRKCKICGHEFETFTCYRCGKQVPAEEAVIGTTMCRKCFSPTNIKKTVKYNKKIDAQLQARFDNWLEKVRAVPKDYPTLTEEQWLAACRHFDGCARCHNSTIDSRGFFIGAKLGGRYCDWNVIPLCEKCATNWNLSLNIFKNARQRDHALKRHGEYRECLENIVDYLGGKLDAAAGIGSETTDSAEQDE